MAELRKQIALYFPLADWQAIRREAARRRIPMTELCRRWMKAGLDDVRRHPDREPDESDQ